MKYLLIETISYEYDTDTQMYRLLTEINYWSPRYKKLARVPVGYLSNGFNVVADLASIGAWVHDYLCEFKRFADGSYCSCWQASCMLGDILRLEGRWFYQWPYATFTWLYKVWSW